MRADDQVAFSALQIPQHLGVSGCGTQTAEVFDLHREAEKALQRRLIMLLGQNGRRDQNGRLLSVQNAFHDRPEGHLRLAEAHVAAEQPVHRDRPLHILLDLGRAAQLVVGLGIGEVLLELPLPARVRGKGIAGEALALGIQGDQLPRHLLRRAFGP